MLSEAAAEAAGASCARTHVGASSSARTMLKTGRASCRNIKLDLLGTRASRISPSERNAEEPASRAARRTKPRGAKSCSLVRGRDREDLGIDPRTVVWLLRAGARKPRAISWLVDRNRRAHTGFPRHLDGKRPSEESEIRARIVVADH